MLLAVGGGAFIAIIFIVLLWVIVMTLADAW